MNKLTLLISAAILWCAGSLAQQPNDSTSNQQPGLIADGSLLFARFSCTIKNSNGVKLQWNTGNTDSIRNGDYFIVERSNDGIYYETIGALKITDTATQYELTDNSPLKGSGFYRIKYTDKAGQFMYSNILQPNSLTDIDFKFYPNPADKLLIIQTGHNADMQVMDGAGTVRLNKKLERGLQVINISSLEKGNYVLRIVDTESNKIISEQFLKN